MLPSIKISDLITREDYEPPVDFKSLDLSSRSVLHAYWRARSVLFVGQPVTLKLVESNAQDDWGYGTVPRSKVKSILVALQEQGWKIAVEDLEEKAKARPKESKRELAETNFDVVAKTPRKKKAIANVSGPHVTAEDELIGIDPAQLKSIKVSRRKVQ